MSGSQHRSLKGNNYVQMRAGRGNPARFVTIDTPTGANGINLSEIRFREPVAPTRASVLALEIMRLALAWRYELAAFHLILAAFPTGAF
jgi:hypothetical protein